jgi:hypothetical protein
MEHRVSYSINKIRIQLFRRVLLDRLFRMFHNLQVYMFIIFTIFYFNLKINRTSGLFCPQGFGGVHF